MDGFSFDGKRVHEIVTDFEMLELKGYGESSKFGRDERVFFVEVDDDGGKRRF